MGECYQMLSVCLFIPSYTNSQHKGEKSEKTDGHISQELLCFFLLKKHKHTHTQMLQSLKVPLSVCCISC